jgi:two-component system LytT family response regulator
VLIVDDEKDMRMLLKKAIEKVEGFEVVGEAENGGRAIEVIESSHPQVVFLDVEMPELDGVECAKRILEINPDTIIIFATGHNEYMSEAFELYAFDYLTKPFKMERVFTTLERIKKVNLKPEENSLNKIIRHEKGLEKLVIKNKEGISFVDKKDIIIIQRENRSTVIYTANSSYTTSEGLSEIEDKLDKTQFLRSHKSYIINISMINKIYPYGRWTYTIKLKNTDKDALLTYDKYEEIKKLFEV